MTTKRFRIAFSFAGDKRDFVSKVAALLAARFGEAAILFDKYHEAEFARYDLGIRLPKLYGELSDLIVPVLSPDYDAKCWTGWEWLHIYDLLTNADGHRVMPSRFEFAKADGLSHASGFIELDNKTPDEFAVLILERLALNEGRPKDHYTKPFRHSEFVIPHSSIPHNLPTLQPFFGREEELQKIATHNPLLAQTSEAERLVLYRETAGKPLLLRWTAGQLGRGHELKAEHHAAITAYCEALEMQRRLAAESREAAGILISLANAEKASGDAAAAAEHVREGLRVARAIDDAEGVATCTGNLADLTLDQNDWSAAETFAREALTSSKAVHRQELIAG